MVDRGYRGVQIEGVRILMSGQKRGITRALKAMIHRRSAIEPAIGHMKMDGGLARNPLKGALGDALQADMCGAGHNLRMILAKLRLLCARIGIALRALLAALAPTARLITPNVVTSERRRLMIYRLSFVSWSGLDLNAGRQTCELERLHAKRVCRLSVRLG